MTLSHWLSTTRTLGIIAAAAVLLCALALQDVAHGEADLRNEWWVLRVGLVLIAAFIATALHTLGKVQRSVASTRSEGA